MSWAGSFFIGVLTAVATSIAAGFVAAACVSWYHISGREGQSDVFILTIGLLSGMAAFVAGMILSRFVDGGFFKGLGISMGGMLGLVGVGLLVSWLLADIPPTINGHSLSLLVEVRLPKGTAQPVAGGRLLEYLEMISSSPFTHEYRARRSGEFQIEKARLEDGRWVVPGWVYIFTTRGERTIAVPTKEHEAVGFGLEFPGHPTAKYEQWSEWLPKIVQGKPWPDTEISYRFRIEENIPGPPPPDPAVVAEAEFAALTPESPLEKWLSYLKYGMDSGRESAILKVVESRPADLVKLLRPPEDQQAIYAVSKLRVADPAVTQAMLAIAGDIETQIRKFTSMKPEETGYVELGNDIRNRFKSWSMAWWTVHRLSGVDGRPPLEAIVGLARNRKEDGFMQEVILDGEAHLGGLTPAAK